MAISLLPWAGAVYLTGGAEILLHFALHAGLMFAIGYGVVSAALPASNRLPAIPLVPAVGEMTVAALTAFWLRLGFPLLLVSVVLSGFAAAGVLAIWRSRQLLANHRIPYGRSLVVLSAIVCFVYFLPGAKRDAVQLRDGSFNWMYADTQFFHSMSASLKYNDGPPKMPGTATADLLYHFGEFTTPALISRLTGVNLGHAIVRVARAESLWALVFSCYGLGVLLSVRATGFAFGGIMSVVGVFFYGALLALFSDERNSSSSVTGAVLATIPDVTVPADGGPFSHLILGHSMLHGLIAITAIMGIALIQSAAGAVGKWREFVCLVLPALAVPIDSPAALYCVGVVGILKFWARLKEMRSWALILLLFLVFTGAWLLMGYAHSPMAADTRFDPDVLKQWWTLVVLFIVGLGFRISGFRWISWPLRDPLSALVLATVIGFLSFSVFLRLVQDNERYGLYFLECMFSVFAFSRLKPTCWSDPERSALVKDWLSLATHGLLFLSIFGVAVAAGAFFRANHRTGITAFSIKLPLTLALLALFAGLLAIMKRSVRASTAGSWLLIGLLSLGFLAWITPWLNFGLGRMKLDITLSPGEVRGLARLKEVAAPRERFATNKHEIERLTFLREKSYGYGAYSERPVLLEGAWIGGEILLPGYKELREDNDLLFTTSDPATLRDIAWKYHISFLVAKPQTNISLRGPLPDWLLAEENAGDLTIYKILP